MSNNNNNHHNEARPDQITEDAPAFHSVAMMSAPPAFPLRSAATESKQAFRVEEHPALRSVSDKKKTLAPVAAGGLVETTPWKVSKPLAIPSYYTLERTHTTVPDASAEEVSARIASFLRTESIAATFDNQQVRRYHSSPFLLRDRERLR